MSLEQSDIEKALASTGIDPALDPSTTVDVFCKLESISKPSFYGLEDKPDGYYIGDSFRIPLSSRIAWRARRMAAAPAIAAQRSEFARARAAAIKKTREA
jgi:hypothetical protein